MVMKSIYIITKQSIYIIIYLPNNNSEHFDVWSRSMANTYQRNKILSTEMDVLRRSARKSRIERIKN
jgi:hypothetical protein